MRRFAALVLAGALSGCGALETSFERDPARSALIGHNINDVIHMVGTPQHYTKVQDPRGPAFQTLEVQWDFANGDTANTVTAYLIGAVQLGGPGKCTMMATVARMGGIVMDVAFPQAHVDGLEPDHDACSPLVHESIHNPSATDLPANFDAWTLADPASNENTGAAKVIAPAVGKKGS